MATMRDQSSVPIGQDYAQGFAVQLADVMRRVELLEKRPRFLRGSGTPEGVVVAPVGSAYLRTDGGAVTTLYIKESGTGAAGWVAK